VHHARWQSVILTVFIGHQTLLAHLRAAADRLGLESAVMTLSRTRVLSLHVWPAMFPKHQPGLRICATTYHPCKTPVLTA
jgi:hypothetical protein